MRNIIASKRYADAFLNCARQTIGFRQGLEELQGLKRVFHDNPDLQPFIESLQITESEKFDLIDTVLAKGFSQSTTDFLKFLIAKKRIELFVDIAEYARIKYAHGDEIDADEQEHADDSDRQSPDVLARVSKN